MRRAFIAIVALGTLAVAMAGPHATVVALKTLVFLPEIFPDAPLRPISWVTAAPNVEHLTLDYPGGRSEIDLYVPAGAGSHGAVIVALGARPMSRAAPDVRRFAEGLSRLGAVVMVPEPSGLVKGLITPDEIDLLVREFQLLRARADVDPRRVGFIGLSVGASLTLAAAADERIADEVAFVNAFGAYFDAIDLLVAVSSRNLEYADVLEPWSPSELTRQVLAENLISHLDPASEQRLVREIYVEGNDDELGELATASGFAQTVVLLLNGLPTIEARREVASLPLPAIEHLEAISPGWRLTRIRADVLVMHDVGDRYIPYTESRRIVATLPPDRLVAWTEFQLFDHVMPGGSRSASFPIELARLYRHAYLTCSEFL